MHNVAVVTVPPATTFDLSIPEVVFGNVTVDGQPGYQVRICTPEPGAIATTGALQVLVHESLDAITDADTVLVTGTGDRTAADARVLTALRDAAEAGKRIASICTGAFVLAQTGLLDGRSATTYWLHSAEFRNRFPAVDLRPGVLFVEDGRFLSSAGLAAGIDLCLHIVRSDYGAAAANSVARLAVVAPVRPGGQAQFIDSPLPPENGTSLTHTRTWAAGRLHEPLTLTDLAAHAHTSIRTLTRRFHAETGMSPLQWLLHQRVDRARELLETTSLSVAEVATRSGLATPDSLRQHLRNRVGLTPSAYRATFTRTPPTPELPEVGWRSSR